MSSRKPVAYGLPYRIRSANGTWELVSVQQQAPLYVMRRVGSDEEKWVKETEIVDMPEHEHKWFTPSERTGTVPLGYPRCAICGAVTNSGGTVTNNAADMNLYNRRKP